MKTPLIAIALLLTCVPASHARGPVLPPMGASVCAPDGACMTLEPTDAPVGITVRAINSGAPYQVSGGLLEQGGAFHWDPTRCTSVNIPFGPVTSGAGVCTLIPGTLVQWEARRAHPYRRKAPYYTALFNRFYSERGDHLWEHADSLIHRPELNSADCSSGGENDRWIVDYKAGLGASTDAPEEFRVACGLERVQAPSDEVEPPARVTPTAVAGSTCESIAYAAKRVAVKSTGLQCSSARTIMSRYLRRGVEPAGFVCVKARAGKVRTAACGKPSRARARARAVKVTGRWRA